MMFGLLFQAVSVILLRHRLGKTWLRRPVTILVLVSVVYQGISPLLLSFPSIARQDVFRLGIAQPFEDEAMLLLSAAMLAFTLAYLATRPERAQPREAGIATAARVLDWRLLALCCAPLAYLTYEGKGYDNAVATGPSTPLTTVLASSFFVILIALAAFSLVLRKGPAWFVPILALQSVLLAAAGERIPVIADAIVVGVLLCHAGARPPARQLAAAVMLTLVAVTAITGARAQEGRLVYYRDSGLGARAILLAEGIPAAAASSDGLAAQGASRLDGVAFTAGILQAESFGQPRLPAAYVPSSLLLAVPGALWPSKLTHPAVLRPVLAETGDFGLQSTNFLPGLPGMYAGFLPPPALIVFLAVLGLLAGWVERGLLASCSPARLVMLAAAILAALSYEQGLPGMTVALRTGALAAAALTAIGAALRRMRARTPRMRSS